MTRTQIIRVFLTLFAGATALSAIACASSPSSPSAAPPASAALSWAAVTYGVSAPSSLAQCLGGGGDASCFSATRAHASSVTGAALTTAPVFNNNQPVLNSGPTVTLSWTSPTSGVATSYIIEASSVPGGPANLANFNTGNAQTTLVVPGVPAGTYYVRVRAFDSGGAGPPSNEVQVIVTSTTGGSCPSAPLNLAVTSGSSSTVVLAWQPPASGVPMSYVVQAGSAPGTANLANFDTNSTAVTLTASGVPAGQYFVRVYGKSNSCAAPAFLGPSSNEVLLTVGAGSSGWSGQIVCRVQISGPNSYHDDETQTWTISGPGQTDGARTIYPVVWTATGSGGAVGKSWTVNISAVTDFTVTVIASTGIPGFDRTSVGLVIRGGYVGTPVSFDYYEQDFPPFAASSPTATSVTGTWSRPTVGGDSPQQPGGSVGTLACSWALTYR
jgi:Fibronectin type III domain